VPDLATTRYEPRLLRVTGLFTEVFWLKSLSQPPPGQETGWVVPYHTFFTDLVANQAHGMQNFKKQLAEVAAGELQKTDPPMLKDLLSNVNSAARAV
jgi:hypothetical protein